MQYSQKYTLVAFLEPVAVGAEFSMSDWPLHVTLADIFAIELSTGVEQKLADLLIGWSPVKLIAGKDTVLGTAEVTLIDKSDELQGLHDKIVDLLEVNDAQFNNPGFTRAGFLPHATIQKSGRLHEGDMVEISKISLVDMFVNGDWQKRKVLVSFRASDIYAL